jgi:hypothetical protein
LTVSISANRTNLALDYDDSDYDELALSLQTKAVLVVFLVGLSVCVVLNFANLHSDFQDLHDFYRGYMGRKMLISEGKLSSREYLDALKLVHEQMVIDD